MKKARFTSELRLQTSKLTPSLTSYVSLLRSVGLRWSQSIRTGESPERRPAGQGLTHSWPTPAAPSFRF